MTPSKQLLTPRHILTVTTISVPQALFPSETFSETQPSLPLALPVTASRHHADLMTCSYSGTRNEDRLFPGAVHNVPSPTLTESPVAASSTPTLPLSITISTTTSRWFKKSENQQAPQALSSAVPSPSDTLSSHQIMVEASSLSVIADQSLHLPEET